MFESPRPAQRGEGGAKRRVRGRALISSSAGVIILSLAVVSCRTARPPAGEELAPVTASSPAEAAQQLAARRSQFEGERSLVRLRIPSSRMNISARGQLQVDRAGRMLLTIYTPLGTTAARLYAEGDEITFLNDLQSNAWRGKAADFAGSLGLFGTALPTESVAMLLVGLPPAGLDSISYAATGIAEVRLPNAVVTYDPPVYPPKTIRIDRDGRHVDVEHLESYADPESLQRPEIPDSYRCCVLPRL